ncbi:BatA domain-containing protein [Anatilimnocola floriformis]|uniref:BatA domain-containing protein n=1 Tax=Anatilimnocola floriformis TaxID=2948575 RepID=UPI0020C446AE|nr:BatA domain-containing protein [Anatilimnocola floriformis]
MQFVHQALIGGFLLAILPVLIHLINMMRHKRVQWAAMEFLLASYKKHRTWVWLKQLLLLLSRMAIIALIVAMLAQLKTKDQWLALFGGKVTHHYVVVDDSYSMSDRIAGASALDMARLATRSIVTKAGQQDGQHKLTLIRFSQVKPAAEGGSEKVSAAAQADFNAETLNAKFDETLEQKQRLFEATSLALTPGDSLTAVKQLMSQGRDETSIVYLLSDFRQKDWESPQELRQAFIDIQELGAEIHLVDCARSAAANLGIVDIVPADETRAAGVPLFVFVSVRNHGTKSASKVQVKVRSTVYEEAAAGGASPEQLGSTTEEIATLLIDEIGPGETITRRVQVFYTQPGKHVVEAVLPEDPIEADNRRWCVINFPTGEKTLVIDGTTEQLHSYYLQIGFRPLQKSNTGIQPDNQPVAFLRDAKPEMLNQYSTIYLLDVPRLDGRAAESLEAYVRGGGGLAIFVGPNTLTDYYNNSLYRGGQGLLPAPLADEADLIDDIDGSTPDLDLEKHPIFDFFLAEANPLLRGVTVRKFRRLPPKWEPAPESGTAIIGRLRDKSPLFIEKQFGKGKVLLCTTTAAPIWNDWAKNPSFVVLALKMQSHLASPRRLDDPRLVGTPLEVQVPAAQYRSEMNFVLPGQKEGIRFKVARNAEKENDLLSAHVGIGLLEGRRNTETDRTGIYEAWPQLLKGDIDLRRWALNVDPDEGNLARLTADEVLKKIVPVRAQHHIAEQYQQGEAVASGYNLSMLVMGILVALLIGEQALAYSTSYHPLRPSVAATQVAAGGRG